MRNISLVMLCTAVINVVACSGGVEPSEDEIKQAMLSQLKSQLEQSSGVFKEGDVKVRYIKKIGCNKVEEQGGYQCDVDIDVDLKLPFVGVQNQKGVQSFRFVKTVEGWNVVQ